MTSVEARLDALLSEDPAAAQRRESAAFDEAAGAFAEKLVLFGAGNLGRRTLGGLRALGVEPLAFTDNDERLWGTEVAGLRVLSPAEAARRFGSGAAFVVTIWRGEGRDRMGERMAQLTALGCRRVVPFAFLFWRHPAAFLPHYALDLPSRVLEDAPAVLKAFALLGDEASRREYVAQVAWRLLADFDGLPDPSRQEIYFPADLFALRDEEVFVDCGAYDGDTLRRFLALRGEAFRRAEAFEPDPANFEKLEKWASTLPDDTRRKIGLHAEAVGAARGTVRFLALGNEASLVGAGDLSVPCVALDDLPGDLAPTYVKMDTEGSEPDALLGCRRTMAEHRPVLAICSYHRQDHLWRVPLLIAEAAPRHRFFLRPQLLEVWDLVCYAVPEDRLLS